MPFKHRHALLRHFARHGAEFNARNAAAYERMADDFMDGPLPSGMLECKRKDGGRVRFDPITSALGIVTKDGDIATYFLNRPLPGSRQTALDYFRASCR